MVQRKVIVRGATNQALDELDAADIPDLSAAYEAAGGIATHSADTTVVHGIADTSVLATDTEVATAVSDHSADTTAVHGITDTAALSLTTHDHDADYEAAGGIATHAGLADPHTGYQKESEKAAASGYASLDAGTKVPIAELPTGTSGTTVALGDAAAALDATHAAAGDPHTGYRLESADHSHASTGLQAGTVAHTALTSVGANDHHAQAHTHPAEGAVVVTHASTTGQGVDDHHAQSHTHASHTGIGANDHHAQTHATAHQPGGADTMAVDAAAATGSLRTLGTGALQAAVGSHTHSGASTAYAPGSFTVATDNFAIMVKRLQLTTTQRATLAGTSRLRIE